MADFTDRLALGTSRMNPSSMVPGAMGGNAPQSGFGSQLKHALTSGAQVANQATGRDYSPEQEKAREDLMRQLSFVKRMRETPNSMNRLSPTAPISEAKPIPGQDMIMLRKKRTQSDLPPEIQQMLPDKKNVKSKTYKKEDFQLLSDVFKTLGDR